MSKLMFILFLFFLSSFAHDEELIIVNNRIWDQMLRYDSFNTSLVLFYDPKCPYCQRTLPEYKRASKTIKQRGLPVTFGKVDLAMIPELGTKANITKVPAIFYFNDNAQPREISAHTFDEIVNFIMNQFHFHSLELTTLEEASKLMLESENVALFYGKQSDKEYQVYRDYLELHEKLNMAFAHIFSSKLIKELELNESCKLTIVRKSDKNNVNFLDDFTIGNLKKFIDIEVYPVVVPFEHRVLQDFLLKAFPLIILIKKEDHKKSDKALKVFEEACKDLRGEIQCVSMGERDEMEVTVMEILGVKSDSLPKMRIMKAKTNETFWKYKPTKEKITVEHVIDFVKEYKSNNIEHYYKGEPVPEHNVGLIKIVVRDNFNTIVNDGSKDVLLLLFAPWCKHCVRAENAMKSLAQTLKGVKNLVFAQTDMAANDYEELQIVELPTLLFYPREKKGNPIKFSEIPNNDNLLNFLKLYVTVERSGALLNKQKAKMKEDL